MIVLEGLVLFAITFGLWSSGYATYKYAKFNKEYKVKANNEIAKALASGDYHQIDAVLIVHSKYIDKDMKRAMESIRSDLYLGVK